MTYSRLATGPSMALRITDGDCSICWNAISNLNFTNVYGMVSTIAYFQEYLHAQE